MIWTAEQVQKLSFPVTIRLVCQINKNGAGFMLKRTDWSGSFTRPWDEEDYSAQQIADYLNEYRVDPSDVKPQG